MKTKAITVDKEILSGTPVFSGTRVPVFILFDYLEGDLKVDDFLKSFPTVKKTQVMNVLQMAEQFITSIASSNESIVG